MAMSPRPSGRLVKATDADKLETEMQRNLRGPFPHGCGVVQPAPFYVAHNELRVTIAGNVWNRLGMFVMEKVFLVHPVV